jgi:branched-chain amino acid transport system substrate-binding protein
MKTSIKALTISIAISGAFSGVLLAKDTVKIGALHDLTGSFNIYGIQQSQALKLAVIKVNEDGGVNGSKVEIVEYDTQSDDARYTQYANTLILRDQVAAMFGGLASSSREAVRPVAAQSKTLYFYNALYEGGVCDRYTFLTGVTPSQQLGVMLEWAQKEYGDKVYVVAPNYNFGTISAHWVSEYAKDYGLEVVGEDFLPVSQSDFSSTLQQIQTSEPDFVFAIPVGSRQTSFYEQFAAAGLKERIGIISTNYGSGNQQVVVSKDAGEGIVASQNYFQVVDTAKNAEFLKMWESEYGEIKDPIISEANDTWNAVMLWAEAANRAGSNESDAVIEQLLNGVELDGPEGTIKSLPSNHLMHQVYLVEGDRNHSFKVIAQYNDVMPEYEQSVCNLLENPNTSMQFTPES